MFLELLEETCHHTIIVVFDAMFCRNLHKKIGNLGGVGYKIEFATFERDLLEEILEMTDVYLGRWLEDAQQHSKESQTTT